MLLHTQKCKYAEGTKATTFNKLYKQNPIQKNFFSPLTREKLLPIIVELQSKRINLFLGKQIIHTKSANALTADFFSANRKSTILLMVVFSLIVALSVSLAITISPVAELINSIDIRAIVLPVLQVLISGILILNLLIS